MISISNKIKEYREIIENLIKLALPILAGNLSQILINLTDTAVAGKYSTTALGAISVASAIVMTILIGAIGLILSVSPVIANLRGQKIPSKKYFKLTLLFSLVISIPFFAIIELFLLMVDKIGLDPVIVPMVKQYIEICAWTIFPVALFTALKEFLQAYEKVVFANLLMSFMVILNLILNVVLTFGWDLINFQGLGVVGLALATLSSKTIAAILILIYCLPLFKTKCKNERHSDFSTKDYVKSLLKVGTPISAAIFFEFLGFNLTAVLIGKFSALYAGVHNIILCIANVTFMIVLSTASAASIKIGYFNGRKEKSEIIKYSNASVFITLCICLISFIIIVFCADNIILIFSKDPEVLVLSKKILKFAMAFLFFDGIQTTCVGILKGLKDTKIIMFTMCLAYLLIAIPVGIYSSYKLNIILEGFWTGLALALMFAAIITSLRVICDIKKYQN